MSMMEAPRSCLSSSRLDLQQHPNEHLPTSTVSFDAGFADFADPAVLTGPPHNFHVACPRLPSLATLESDEAAGSSDSDSEPWAYNSFACYEAGHDTQHGEAVPS